jgi:hypothetical protein
MAVHLDETKSVVAVTAVVHTPSVNQVQKPQVKATRPVCNANPEPSSALAQVRRASSLPRVRSVRRGQLADVMLQLAMGRCVSDESLGRMTQCKQMFCAGGVGLGVTFAQRTLHIMYACCRALLPSLKKERIMVPTAVPVGYGRL